jgi:hypothetical protein
LTQHLICQHTQHTQVPLQHGRSLTFIHQQWMGAAAGHAAYVLPRQPQRCIHSWHGLQSVATGSSNTSLQQQAARHSFHAIESLQGISILTSSSSGSSSSSSSTRAYHVQHSTGERSNDLVAAGSCGCRIYKPADRFVVAV